MTYTQSQPIAPSGLGLDLLGSNRLRLVSWTGQVILKLSYLRANPRIDENSPSRSRRAIQIGRLLSRSLHDLRLLQSCTVQRER